MEKGSHRRLEEISQVIRSNLPAAVAMSYLPSHFALIYISELDIGLHGFIFRAHQTLPIPTFPCEEAWLSR